MIITDAATARGTRMAATVESARSTCAYISYISVTDRLDREREEHLCVSMLQGLGLEFGGWGLGLKVDSRKRGLQPVTRAQGAHVCARLGEGRRQVKGEGGDREERYREERGMRSALPIHRI